MSQALSARPARTHAPFVPPQHGAWAFLLLPLALSWTLSPHGWVWLVLLWAWVAAYPTSYFALSMLRARRRERFRRPLAVWAALTVPPAAWLLALRPWLGWPLLAALALFGVNMAYARRNRERDLLNEVVFVTQCSAMVAVSWLVAADPGTSDPRTLVQTVPERVWLAGAVCALVLLGSTLHVKSLLRERRDPRYSVASRLFSLASVAVSVGVAAAWGLPGGALLVVPFVALAGRAHVRDWSRLRPAQIGLVELAAFLVTVAAVALA